jgi:hypothetical protein
MTRTLYALYFFVLLLIALSAGLGAIINEGIKQGILIIVCLCSLFLAYSFGATWEDWAYLQDNSKND